MFSLPFLYQTYHFIFSATGIWRMYRLVRPQAQAKCSDKKPHVSFLPLPKSSKILQSVKSKKFSIGKLNMTFGKRF